jgi:CRISPR-associated protein Cas9/Csn1, subtype II/NMEMI
MKYSLGLDIGTNSCGWSVINLDKKRIEDLGVRIFDGAENPKNGQSLATPRREKRGMRKRLHRRRIRLNFLKQFFVQQKILSRQQIESLLTPHKNQIDPYIVREKALSEKLTPEELFVALYHISKRRGYKSNRRTESSNDSSENKKTLSAITANQEFLKEYQTVAEALNHADKFKAHKRNKPDDYSNSFARADFENEITKILSKQAEFYPALNEENIKDLLYRPNFGVFFQRRFLTPKQIEEMRGKCQFEKDKPRAQRASYSFEFFRLASDLVHLTYNMGNKLTIDEIAACIEKAKELSVLKYSHIQKILAEDVEDEINFDYVRGLKRKDLIKDETEAKKKALEQKLGELKFYHAIKKALKDQPAEWKDIESNIELFDNIGFVLTANKEDDSVREELEKLGLKPSVIDGISNIKQSFAGFGHLSLEALRKITPFILQGETYDKAVVDAGYIFTAKLSGDSNRLSALSKEENNQITNPVVKRAISQSIKVVNAIILKYGAPTRLHIECASELAKSFEKRNEIIKTQDENRENNEKIIARLKDEFHVLSPTAMQIIKFKLYEQQDGKCLYSGSPIDLNRLFSDEHYCEIDHIIPKSRCGNDSMINKVLVLNQENQEKRNQTPFEAWGSDEKRWQSFIARVESNPKIFAKKRARLLAKTPPKEDWNARALNDTRYITRFLSNYFKQNLKFAEHTAGKKVVYTPTGNITSYLRHVWHIGKKDRSNNLHHAVDATITALVTDEVIRQCALMNKMIELGAKYVTKGINLANYQNGILAVTDPVTGEIVDLAKYEEVCESVLPWSNFDHEVRFRATPLACFIAENKEDKKKAEKKQLSDGAKAHLQNTSINTLAEWRDQFREIYKDQDEEFKNSIHPIFVSRMPKRKGTGSLHDDTIRSPKGILIDKKTGIISANPNRSSFIRKRLQDVKIADLENSILKQSDKVLYQQLKNLLEANDDDPKKAFKEPVYKNNVKIDKNGRPLSPVITIKINDDKNVKSGILLNHGTQFVNNGSMIRLDIYKKEIKGKNQLFYVPVYAHQVRKGSTRILPTTCGYDFVDETFIKLCSVYPNDYLIMKKGDEILQGYYIKYDITNAVIAFASNLIAGNSIFDRISCRSLSELHRLDISVLGDNYPWERLY